MNESEFEQAIVDAARVFGWKAVGHRPMRTKHGWATGWKYDGVGWPDLTLIHAAHGLLLTAELKTTKVRLSNDQTEWGDTLSKLEATTAGVCRYYVWRPADWNEIVTLLSAGKATPPAATVQQPNPKPTHAHTAATAAETAGGHQ